MITFNYSILQLNVHISLQQPSFCFFLPVNCHTECQDEEEAASPGNMSQLHSVTSCALNGIRNKICNLISHVPNLVVFHQYHKVDIFIEFFTDSGKGYCVYIFIYILTEQNTNTSFLVPPPQPRIIKNCVSFQTNIFSL